MNDKITRILLIGGTGKTGKHVAKLLDNANIDYRFGTPKTDIPFDWYDESTWPNALNGIKSIYTVFFPDLAVPGAPEIVKRFTQAAKQADVEHIVLLSGRGEEEAVESEDTVRDSGLDWTIVRCSWFMQNFSENFFLEDIRQGHVAIPIRPSITEPFVDTEDIAEVVFAALTDHKHRGHLYELTGPELLSFQEVVKRISDMSGKTIDYAVVSYDEYETALREAGLPDNVTSLIRYLFTEVLDGRNESLTDGIEQALGRKPRTINHYIRRTIASGVWE